MTGATTWAKEVSSLMPFSHTFTAKAKASGGASSPWEMSVVPAVKPSIASVKDGSGKEIPEGGATVNTSVTLSGRAAAGQVLAILESGEVLDTAQVDSAGNWTATLPVLQTNTPHSVTVRGLYTPFPASQARTFTLKGIISGGEDFLKESDRRFPLNQPVVFLSGLTAILKISDVSGSYSSGIEWVRGVPYLKMVGASTIKFNLPGVCHHVGVMFPVADHNPLSITYEAVDGTVIAKRTISSIGEGYIGYDSPNALISSFFIEAQRNQGAARVTNIGYFAWR